MDLYIKDVLKWKGLEKSNLSASLFHAGFPGSPIPAVVLSALPTYDTSS